MSDSFTNPMPANQISSIAQAEGSGMGWDMHCGMAGTS